MTRATTYVCKLATFRIPSTYCTRETSIPDPGSRNGWDDGCHHMKDHTRPRRGTEVEHRAVCCRLVMGMKKNYDMAACEMCASHTSVHPVAVCD